MKKVSTHLLIDMNIDLEAFAAATKGESRCSDGEPRTKRTRSDEDSSTGRERDTSSSGMKGVNRSFAKLTITNAQVTAGLVNEMSAIRAALSLFFLLLGRLDIIKFFRGGRSAYDSQTKGKRNHGLGPLDLMNSQIAAK